MAQQCMSVMAIAICFMCLVNISNGGLLTEDQHNIYQCPDPGTAKTPLCRKDIKETGKFLQVITEVIDCPESGVNPRKISCIIVTNRMGDNGGYANVVSGGINDYKVEISLKSQFGKGLDYQIEIYTGEG